MFCTEGKVHCICSAINRSNASYLCVKIMIYFSPLGETGLSLSEPVGEVQVDPLDLCSSSLGGCGDRPFSVRLLDAEVGILATRFCRL